MIDNVNFRFRRLRNHAGLRELVRETHVRAEDFILPIFVEEGIDTPLEIASMPGVLRYPESQLAERVQEVWRKGIKAVILFGVSHHKDSSGSDAMAQDGLIARMCRIAKHAQPQMLVISDTCFCEYTDHGHCGIINNNNVDNDMTLVNLQRQAVVAAGAGADMIAPSGMMDGMVAAIRSGLDEQGFSHIPIMSYSSKFASAFYGPFRDAVDSEFKGSRCNYQLDIANAREAVAESLQDEYEGADILMVKPGMAYLDILNQIRWQTRRPLAVYQVSGEYAMLQQAVQSKLLDEMVILESLIAFKRAGADLIISYFSEKAIELLQ